VLPTILKIASLSTNISYYMCDSSIVYLNGVRLLLSPRNRTWPNPNPNPSWKNAGPRVHVHVQVSLKQLHANSILGEQLSLSNRVVDNSFDERRRMVQTSMRWRLPPRKGPNFVCYPTSGMWLPSHAVTLSISLQGYTALQALRYDSPSIYPLNR
jgi:hypothetical protein